MRFKRGSSDNRNQATNQPQDKAKNEKTSVSSREHQPHRSTNPGTPDSGNARINWIERLTLIFAAVAALGSAGGVVVGYWQWSSISGQLTEMKASRRPWVSLDGDITINNTLTFDEMGAHVTIAGILKNGGGSIAKNIQGMTSRLLVQQIMPQNVAVSPSELRHSLFRGLPEGCNQNIARQFTSIGGALLLPSSTEHWRPGNNGLISTPRSEFVISGRGRVSVWIDICIFYNDDTDGIHGTPLVLLFVNERGESDIMPTGEVQGSFQISAGGEPPY